MARQIFYSEELSRTTTNSTSFVDKATLTFTPDASSDYLVIASLLLDGSNTSFGRNPRARLWHDSASVELNLLNDKINLNSEANCLAGLRRYQAPANPPAQTFKLQFSVENAADTAGASDAAIVALKLDAADAYAESLTLSSTTSTTWADKVTLSFTPSTAGDYLILACAGVGANGNSKALCRLTDGASVYGEAQLEYSEAGRWRPYAAMVRRNLSGAQTWKLQFSAVSGSRADIHRAVLVALRLDAGFVAQYYGEDLLETTTSSQTAVTKHSLVADVAAQDYLFLSCGLLANGNGFHTVNTITQEDASNLRARDDAFSTGANTQWKIHFGAKKITPVAGSHTYKRGFYIATSGTGRFKNSSIALLQLTAAGGGAEVISQSAAIPYETLTGTSVSATIVFDATTLASQISLVSYESLASAAQTVAQNFEVLAEISSAILSQWETLSGLSSSKTLELESLAQLTSAHSLVLEALAISGLTAVIRYEALGYAEVIQEALIPIEALGMTALSSDIDWEALTEITEGGVLPWEGLGEVRLSATPNYESMTSMTLTATVQFESQLAIALAREFLFEARGTITPIINLVERVVEFTIRLDREAKFTQRLDRDVDF